MVSGLDQLPGLWLAPSSRWHLSRSLAQPSKAVNPVDLLLKSIGLSKPAMTSAPDFNLLDTNGSPVGLSAYRGKLVLLNFWATWCGPCREEMPSMRNLMPKFWRPGVCSTRDQSTRKCSARQ